jgi:proline iminopeptidase
MVFSGSRIQVDGGEIWFKVVGGGSGVPLLVIHGIPGSNSGYLDLLGALADDRPVIFYDQLGGGRSERPSDAGLWTLDRFVGEVASVRAALGFPRVHLLGHSWGGMLAIDHAVENPEGVVSLVLSSVPVSIPRYVSDIRLLRDGLPKEHLNVLAAHDRGEPVDAASYQDSVLAFRQRHTFARTAWPAEFNELLGSINSEVFVAIWGADPFDCTGSVKRYERDLGSLTMPMLLTVGAHDATTPAAAEAYRQSARHARLHVFQNSAHMSMLEEPEEYLGIVRHFLREVDAQA